MSRRAPTRNAPPPADDALPKGALLPKIWVPAGAVMAIAVIVLGVMVAMGFGNSDKVADQASQDCVVGTPGCVLRQPVHWHADFSLMIDGKQFDFGQPQFISVPGGKELSPDVHIHDPRHTVVHVHREQTTWSEFFTSLGFKITDPSLQVSAEQTCLTMPDGTKHCNGDDDKTFKFIVNGVAVDGIASENISDLDRVLVSFGTDTDAQVMAQYNNVTDQACIPSQRCKSRIPPDEPPEPCSGPGACIG